MPGTFIETDSLKKVSKGDNKRDCRRLPRFITKLRYLKLLQQASSYKLTMLLLSSEIISFGAAALLPASSYSGT